MKIFLLFSQKSVCMCIKNMKSSCEAPHDNNTAQESRVSDGKSTQKASVCVNVCLCVCMCQCACAYFCPVVFKRVCARMNAKGESIPTLHSFPSSPPTVFLQLRRPSHTHAGPCIGEVAEINKNAHGSNLITVSRICHLLLNRYHIPLTSMAFSQPQST